MSRQNVYDDPGFFNPYNSMRSAGSGLNEALEQPALIRMLPDVRSLTVVDLGCGSGGLARQLHRRGAALVVGVDPSANMLALAPEGEGPSFVRSLAEDVEFRSETVDLVVSSLALHYVADLGAVAKRIVEWLRPGGQLVASMEHPIVTANGSRPPGASGFELARYADEGPRSPSWFIGGVTKYHRTVSSIFGSLTAAGLVVLELAEPAPTDEVLRLRPDLDVHRDRPPLLLVRAAKPDRVDPAAPA